MGSTFPDKVEPDPDLISVFDFSIKYRVDASVVRRWIKMGYINYVLDGPRHMRKIRISEVVKPLVDPPPTSNGGTDGATNNGPEPGSDSGGNAGGATTSTQGDTISTGRPPQVPESAGGRRSTPPSTPKTSSSRQR